MKAIEIRPGNAPKLTEIENTPVYLQQLVGGDTQAVPLADTGLVVVVNRDGRERGMEPTGCLRIWPIRDDILHGPILIVRAAMDTFTSVRAGDLEKIQRIYREVRPDV